MVTAVLFVDQATPTTITQFHDQIMNQNPEILPAWEFELGIFLNNKNSKPLNTNTKQVPNRYLYTLQLSYLNEEEGGNRMISIINNNKSVVTCVPNSTNILNALESFTTKGLNYYKDDDDDDHDDHNEIEDKKINDESKDESVNKEEEIKVEPSTEDVEMTDAVAESADPKTDSVDAVAESKDSTTSVVATEVDDDLILSKFESNSLKEIKRRKKLLRHIQNGCCNNLNTSTKENLEYMLASKLQSLWTLKQTIRGQGGLGYVVKVNLDDGSGEKSTETFRLKTNNCLLHGSFKGFLIEIEHVDKEMDRLEIDSEVKNVNETERKNRLILRFSRSINLIQSLMINYDFPKGNLCYNVLSDYKLEHLSDLCQQYCDALQF